jgi:hypothetical protein
MMMAVASDLPDLENRKEFQDARAKFDPNGKMVAQFGQGMFVFPHGIHVDRDGNIWVTDASDGINSAPLDQLRHDLKTPLTTIHGRAQLLARGIRRAPNLSEEERTRKLDGVATIEAMVLGMKAGLDRLPPSAWSGHIPFGAWLVAEVVGAAWTEPREGRSAFLVARGDLRFLRQF